MRLVDVLKTRQPGPVPMWLMRQAGRYLPEYREVRARAGSFLNLCYSPDLAIEVTLQPVRRFGFDAAILFSDILVIPDALGQEVRFVEGEGPRLDPISDAAAIAALSADRLERHLAPVFETVAGVRAQLDRATALIGFCGAPWTVATYMIAGQGTADQAPARQFAYRDREAFSHLIDLLVEASIRYLNAQVSAGANVLQIFDTWAGVLPESEFVRWCIAPVKRIVDGVRARHPDIPFIVFPRGAGTGMPALLEQTGVEGIGLDTSISLSFVRDRLQPHVTVQGNLDPLVLAVGGAVLDEAVERILGELGGGPFIFNLGHGIIPHTPPDHVARLVQRVRAFKAA